MPIKIHYNVDYAHIISYLMQDSYIDKTKLSFSSYIEQLQVKGEANLFLNCANNKLKFVLYMPQVAKLVCFGPNSVDPAQDAIFDALVYYYKRKRRTLPKLSVSKYVKFKTTEIARLNYSGIQILAFYLNKLTFKDQNVSLEFSCKCEQNSRFRKHDCIPFETLEQGKDHIFVYFKNTTNCSLEGIEFKSMTLNLPFESSGIKISTIEEGFPPHAWEALVGFGDPEFDNLSVSSMDTSASTVDLSPIEQAEEGSRSNLFFDHIQNDNEKNTQDLLLEACTFGQVLDVYSHVPLKKVFPLIKQELQINPNLPKAWSFNAFHNRRSFLRNYRFRSRFAKILPPKYKKFPNLMYFKNENLFPNIEAGHHSKLAFALRIKGLKYYRGYGGVHSCLGNPRVRYLANRSRDVQGDQVEGQQSHQDASQAGPSQPEQRSPTPPFGHEYTVAQSYNTSAPEPQASPERPAPMNENTDKVGQREFAPHQMELRPTIGDEIMRLCLQHVESESEEQPPPPPLSSSTPAAPAQRILPSPSPTQAAPSCSQAVPSCFQAVPSCSQAVANCPPSIPSPSLPASVPGSSKNFEGEALTGPEPCIPSDNSSQSEKNSNVVTKKSKSRPRRVTKKKVKKPNSLQRRLFGSESELERLDSLRLIFPAIPSFNDGFTDMWNEMSNEDTSLYQYK